MEMVRVKDKMEEEVQLKEQQPKDLLDLIEI